MLVTGLGDEERKKQQQQTERQAEVVERQLPAVPAAARLTPSTSSSTSFGSVWLAAVKLDSNKQYVSRLHRGYRRLKKLFKRVANQTLTASPQPAVTVEGPVFKMSPPTNDVTNGVVIGAPGDLVAPARLPTPAINSSSGGNNTPTAVQGMTTTATGDNNTTTTITPAIVQQKRSSNDFIFGKVIGEGSFSTVYLAKDIHSSKEYAIKVLEKRHIIKEKKSEYVKREKEVLNMLASASYSFVRLFCTFQDFDRLYFVLSYAKNGELLPYINKVGSFDIECTKFYSAEILRGLEYLHGLGIIHRDLKPENILLDEKMHILITDFGSAKILKSEEPAQQQQQQLQQQRPGDYRRERRNSFVGTAQYVSPELLTEKTTSRASDIWALGCIIYQMVAGLPPFRARSEYLIFQKILQVDYEIPDGFCDLARDLVGQLLRLKSSERLGASDEHGAGYPSIRAHTFFAGVDFESLHEQTPPAIYPYLPGTSEHEELRSHYRVPDNLKPGLDDKQLTRLLGLGIAEPSDEEDDSSREQQEPELVKTKSERREQKRRIRLERLKKKPGISELSEGDIGRKLEEQKSNPWTGFVENHLIIKHGFVNKRKGLFARRRMLLLTTGPHLYYVDPVASVLKGEIPWSKELRVEPKNFKIFFVHTPNRTYYLEDPEGFALEWCQAIEEVRVHYYGAKEETDETKEPKENS